MRKAIEWILENVITKDGTATFSELMEMETVQLAAMMLEKPPEEISWRLVAAQNKRPQKKGGTN